LFDDEQDDQEQEELEEQNQEQEGPNPERAKDDVKEKIDTAKKMKERIQKVQKAQKAAKRAKQVKAAAKLASGAKKFALLANPYFWIALLIILAIIVLIGLIMSFTVMPSNFMGKTKKFVEGMIIAGRGESKGGIPFICNNFAFPETNSTIVGTGTHDFTLNGYTSAGFTITNTDGYISAMGYGNELYDWLFVASECAGNSISPVGDYTYKTTNLNGVRVALLGGYWSVGARAGSFYWALVNALSNRGRTVGGRAALVPRKLTHAILT
jgi:hypothetical protein